MKKEQPATDQRALVFNNQVQTKLRVKEKKKSERSVHKNISSSKII